MGHDCSRLWTLKPTIPDKAMCPLLYPDNPDWKKHRQELYDLINPLDNGVASEIWWHGKVCLYIGEKDRSEEYEFALTRPLKDIIPLVASQDSVTLVIVEWRLKHG